MTGSCWTALTMPRGADREIDHLGEHERAGPPRIGLGVGGVERRLQLHQLDLDGGDDDLVLGLELVVDRGLRHADGVGDHLERRAVDPVLGEQVERGGDDPGLRRAAVDVPPNRFAGRRGSPADGRPRLASTSRSATLAPSRTGPAGRRRRRGGAPCPSPRPTRSSTSSSRSASPGAHLTDDVVPDDFVLMLGVDLEQLPEVPRVDDGVTYAKADLDIRQQVDVDSGVGAAGLQRTVARRFPLHRLLEGRARHEVPPVERGVPTCSASTAGRPRSRAGTGTRRWPRSSGPRGRPGRARARAHARRVPPRRGRSTSTRTRPSPTRTGPPRASCTPGCSSPTPAVAGFDKARARPLAAREARVPAASASRRGPPRSSCGTASTRCSTSSGRCGARRSSRREAPQGRVPRHRGNGSVEEWMKDLQLDATAMPGQGLRR